jgi:competence protein ComEA
MNLRLPIIATVAAAAVGVAALRAAHRDVPPALPAAAVFTADPAPPPPPRPLAVARPRVMVYVAGDVAHAGVYALPPQARAVDAVHAAGGAAAGADLVAVNLAAPVSDGEEIVVPVRGAVPPDGGAEASSGASDGAAASGTPASQKHHRKKKRRRKHRPAVVAEASDGAVAADPPAQTVNLNTADENELETLPGIGASLAERIVAFRAANGPFTSPDDLLDVGGMTQSRLDAIAGLVTTR